MDDRADSPMTDEERALAERGALLVAAAVTSPEAQAPPALRERLEDRRGAVGAPRARPGWRRVVGALAVAGAIAGTVFAGLNAGSDLPGGPDVLRVATVSVLAPDRPAPASLGGLQPKLDAQVEGVAFPDWLEEFEWEAVGRRDDDLGGRSITTVTYRSPEGVPVGYSIVSGEALAQPKADRTTVRGEITYRLVDRGGQTVVTWEEQGHTCVLVAPSSVPLDKLVDLASWDNF